MIRVALVILALAAARVARAEIASWYGESHRGKPMAWRGRPFDPDALTCASWAYPFGTRLRVWYRERSVVVTVTDRGPALWTGAQIDLSRAAFARLTRLSVGRVNVRIETKGTR